MTIDPGLSGTGFALWDLEQWKEQIILSKKSIYKIHPITNGNIYREDKIVFVLEKLIMKYNIVEVYIEQASFMGTTAKGQMVAGKGYLVKLAGFIGRITDTFKRYNVKVELVPVMKWKGTMTKDAVIKRICKRVGDIEANSHAWDAIGVGLYMTGVF